MPLNAQSQAFLEQLAAMGGPQLYEMPVEEARAAANALLGDFGGPQQAVRRVEDRIIPGPAGPIPVRVYTPVAGVNLPALLYFHGGGWVICNLDTHDRQCRGLANESGCVVISVDYRLAPEHRYPAAVDDCWAAVEYIAGHGEEFGVDPARLAVGGDSAGGTLAAAMTLRAREKGGPRLAFQLLIYPCVDLNDKAGSMQEFGDGYFLTLPLMDWMIRQYIPDKEARRDVYASPTHAGNFQNLPAAFVITAECDPLRDQGETYARKLEQAGVPVRLKRYEGVFHPFFQLGGVLDAANEALRDAGSALRQVLGSASAAG